MAAHSSRTSSHIAKRRRRWREDQAFWHELSPQATQVKLHGGHDIDLDDPTGVAAEILELVEAAR